MGLGRGLSVVDCGVGGIAGWRDCGSWVVGIATRIAGSGIACVSAGLSVVQDCVVGGIAGLRVGGIADAYCTSRDCRIAGLQAVGCQDCQRVGLRGRWDCRMRDCRSWDCCSRDFRVGLRV